MSQAKVLSRGYITIPKEVREELNLTPGDDVGFLIKTDNEVRITKVIEEDKILSKAKLSEKGQIILPKEIIDTLGLEKDDILIFSYVNYFIYMRKQGKLISCPACNGNGFFEGYDLPCFICDTTSVIENHEKGIIFNILFQNKLRKYFVASTFINHELTEEGEFIEYIIPKFLLRSTKYPKDLLDQVQDVIQTILIKEYAPRRTQNPSEFMYPNDAALENVLNLLNTDKAKEDVRTWFRKTHVSIKGDNLKS